MLFHDFITNDKKIIHKWQHYFPIYEKHFERFRNRSVVFYEIGVQNGGSAQMWKRYFGPFAKIVGIDIDPGCKAHEESQINICIGSQSDEKFLQSVIDEHGAPDIVLDDGSHISEDMRASFNFLYDRVSKDGVYMVEDISSLYINEKHRCPGEGFIDFCKSLIDELNARYTSDSTTFADQTFSISFYDSVITFEKIKWPKYGSISLYTPGDVTTLKTTGNGIERIEYVKVAHENK